MTGGIISGELAAFLEITLFFLLVGGAAVWQLWSVSKSDGAPQTSPERGPRNGAASERAASTAPGDGESG